MKHFSSCLILFSALALTACGDQSKETTTKGGLSSLSVTAAEGTKLQTVNTTISAQTVLNVPGLGVQTIDSPAGLKAAYLFRNGQVKTRVDIPAASFPDGRARIVVYDSASADARVVFADTQAQDPDIDKNQIVDLVQPRLSVTNPTSAEGMQSQTVSNFKSLMNAKGMSTTDTTANVNGINSSVTQATATLSDPNGGTQSTVFTFDQQSGMVVQSSSTLNSPQVNQQTTTNYTFTPVNNLAGVNVPTHLHTFGTMATPDSGVTTTITQDIDFQNIEINSLSDSYFSIGGL